MLQDLDNVFIKNDDIYVHVLYKYIDYVNDIM